MATNTRRMSCTPDDVFRVLQDGWLYPVWVVGATRMREVDDEWPAPDAKLHHTFGTWPFVLDDTTRSVEWAPPHRMRLIARGWPVGEASVTIRVRTDAGGCVVRIDEEPRTGPATLIPRFLTTPLLRARNAETLRRLAYIAEGRATQRQKEDMNSNSSRNNISTEPSPGPEDHDNLGAEDAKGTPPTVPPTGRGDGDGSEDVPEERAD